MSVLPAMTEIRCGVSRTKQKVGYEHDINKLVKKYQRTGEMPMLTDRGGQFVDVSAVGDFQDCQEKILRAQEMFTELPSGIRRRFDNSINKYAEFVTNLVNGDKATYDEALKLGLVTPKEPVATANKDEKKGGENS